MGAAGFRRSIWRQPLDTGELAGREHHVDLAENRPCRGSWKPAGAAWRTLRASGWLPWQPLVPQQAFADCVVRAVRSLKEAEPTERFGHYLEFGVSRGTSMACAYHALRKEGVASDGLVGFDSFEGMPAESSGQGWAPGQFHSTIDATRGYLRKNGVDLSRVHLVQGWFKDTLNDRTRDRLSISRASLIMVDCDIYSASKEALDFCAPLIGNYAVVMFDDWGWREIENEAGQKEAFAEFLREHPALSARPLEAYFDHARVFLLTRQGAERQSSSKAAA